jgi:hypothetical protein
MLLKGRIICLLVLLLNLLGPGCRYTEPDLAEPYAIVHPLTNLRINAIDDELTVDLSGRYIFRVRPGHHTLIMSYGSSEAPVEGTNSPRAHFPLDTEEGFCYYIEPKTNYGFEDFFLGLGIRGVKSWKPVVKSKEPIAGYHKPAAQPSVN